MNDLKTKTQNAEANLNTFCMNEDDYLQMMENLENIRTTLPVLSYLNFCVFYTISTTGVPSDTDVLCDVEQLFSDMLDRAVVETEQVISSIRGTEE